MADAKMEVEPHAAMNYLVTAHKPTAVVKALAGNLTAEDDLNLIIAKSTRLEVFRTTAQGLEAVLEVPIYGRISCLELFRPKALKQDLLFILTEKYKFFVLQYNAATRELETRCSGDATESVGRPSDNGQMVTIDPEGRCVVMHLYDGKIKVIPIKDDQGNMSEAFMCRLDHYNAMDIKMLPGFPRPTFAILYKADEDSKHVKVYEISIKDKDIQDVPGHDYRNLDKGTNSVAAVPQPLGGVLMFGEQCIMYMSPGGHNKATAPMRPCIIKSVGKIDADGSRWLLSDHMGIIYVLVIKHADGKVTDLQIETVGRTSSASSLVYLDSGVVFVGSRTGDSQLVRLHATPPDPAQPGSYIQVLETWPNLGSIVDFTVIDMDRQGQGQLVSCSGCSSDGTLRVVRNGVGLHEQASIDLPGIRGVWTLRPSWSASHHKYLVLTFVGETRILAMNDEDELDEAEVSGFDAEALSLWCGNTASDHLVQVTPAGVRAVSCDGGMLEGSWSPDQHTEGAAGGGNTLSVASGNATQVVVASGGGNLHVLSVGQSGVSVVASHNLGSEIACVDITPTGNDPLASQLVAVGTWDMEVHLVSLTPGQDGAAGSLTVVSTAKLEGDVIPRSVLQWVFEGVPYLMVGLGDGNLHYWRISKSDGSLTDRKKLILGSKPVLLRPFKSSHPVLPGQDAAMDTSGAATTGTSTTAAAAAAAAAAGVFAASDRPAVLYSHNGKILFANLNESEINYMAPFNCQSFPDALAIAKESCLTIGSVDEIQKLHIRTVPIHEQPRRIAYQEENHALGVLTITNMSMTDEYCSLRVFDSTGSMELRASYQLLPGEMGWALVSCKLADTDPNTYFVAGTTISTAGESIPSRGRVLVLSYTQGQLSLVAAKEFKGAVFDLSVMQGGKLVVACNNKVHVMSWSQKDDSSYELVQECSATGHVLTMHTDVRGNHVLIGDLQRSLVVFLYQNQQQQQQAGGNGAGAATTAPASAAGDKSAAKLQLRAQDFNTHWSSALSILDDDTYLLAEGDYNLVVLRKNVDTTSDEDAGRLETVGQIHAGELINRIRPGSLVVRHPDSSLAQVPTWLMGSVDGAVLMMASLPPPVFEFLTQLQDSMRKVVKGVGGLHHADWRCFSNSLRTMEARGFVDGDLIECFLDMKHEDQQKVVSLMKSEVTVEEVIQKVEELARLH